LLILPIKNLKIKKGDRSSQRTQPFNYKMSDQEESNRDFASQPGTFGIGNSDVYSDDTSESPYKTNRTEQSPID